MKQDYDVIVAGASLGNLALAALLSRHGRRVLLLEPAPEAQGACSTFRTGNYVFERYPYLLWGLEKEGALQYLLDDLEIDRRQTEELFLPLDPLYQVVLPEHRLSLFRDPDPFHQELRREFPSEYPALVRLYGEMAEVNRRWAESYGGHPFLAPLRGEKPFSSLSNSVRLCWDRWRGKTSARYLRDLPSSGPVEEFLNLQTLYFSGLPFRSTPLLTLALIAGLPSRGCCGVKGGGPALAGLLEQAIRRWGGEITYETSAEHLLLKKRRVVGIKATHGGVSVEITAPSVVLNGLDRHRPDLLIPEHPPHPDGAGPVACTLFLGIDEKVVPEPMGTHVLFRSATDRKGQAGARSFFLSLSPPGDASRSPRDKRALTVMTCAPSFQPLPGPEGRDLTGEEIALLVAELEDLLPFLGRFADVAAGRIFPLTGSDQRRRRAPTPENHWHFGGAVASTRWRGLMSLQDSPFPSQAAAPLLRSAVALARKLCAS